MGVNEYSVGDVGADARGGGERRGGRAGGAGGRRRGRRCARAGRVGARQRRRRLAALPGRRARGWRAAAAHRVSYDTFSSSSSSLNILATEEFCYATLHLQFCSVQ